MSLPNWTNSQVLAQLNTGAKWTSLTITYAFPTSYGGLYTTVEANGFRAVDANQQVFFRLAIQAWDDLVPQTFQQVTSTSYAGANIEFGYTQTMQGNGYAYAYPPMTGSAWFSLRVGQDADNSTSSPVIGYHGFETLMHEIGHALGLDHMGNYDAGNGQPIIPSSYQDSAVFSIMSYFGPTVPDYRQDVAQADWTASNGHEYEPQTPMLNDVMAIQSMYGVSTNTRLGDTVYGFASNITGEPGRIFDFTRNLYPILTLFDSGGNDTLNLSGWSSASNVSLVSGVYSSANDMTNNIVIAYSAVIENAVGGSGNDRLAGNNVANNLSGGAGNDQLLGAEGDDTLTGGTGNDTIDGGTGSDTATFAGTFASYTISYSAVTFTYTLSGAASGTDFVSQVEFFQFSDLTRSAAQLLSTDTVAPTLSFLAPLDDAAAVPAATNLVFTFNESVQAGTGNIVIFNSNGTVAKTIAITDASQVTITGSTVTVNPATDLAAGSNYYVNIAAGVVKDLAGNAFAGIAGTTAYNFATAATDSSAPVLSLLSPPDNATNVAVSANLVLTFSESVQAGTGNIVIFNGNGTVAKTISVTDASQVSIAGNTVTINPSTNLEANSSYYLNIAPGVFKDLANNAFAGISGTTAYNFTTQPADDFSFDTGTTGVVTVNGAAASGTINYASDADLFAVTLVAGKTYMFDLHKTGGGLANPYLQLFSPSLALVGFDDDSGGSLDSRIVYTAAASGTYYIGARDYASGTGGYTVSAMLVDTGAPTLIDTTPADNATGVAPTANIVLTFSEAVVAGIGNILVYNASGTLVRTIAVGDTSQVTFSGSTVTINPSSDLSWSTGYYVNMAGGVIRDVAGNAFAGISNTTDYNFTTQAPSATDDFTFDTGTSGVVTINGAAAAGAVNFAYDADLFKVNLVSGVSYVFNLARTSGGLTDPYLQLYSPDVQLLDFNDDGGDSQNSRLTYTATTTGTYYLGAMDFGNGTGGYTLSATTVTDDFPWLTSTTGVVTVNGAPRSGVVNFATDADLFKVSLVAGTSYRFTLTSSTSGLDPYLELYDPSVILVAYDDDSGGSGNSSITFTAATSGTYYLGASDFGSGTGAYTVAAATIADDYPWSFDTDGFVVPNGLAVTGAVNTVLDQDLFAVYLLAGANYEFELTRTAGGLDPYLELYGPNFGFLTANDDESLVSTNSRITYTASTTGFYYVGAMDFDLGTGAYSLSVTESFDDDYPWDTGTTGVVTINGAGKTGVIDYAYDADLFQVNLVAGTTYVFNLSRTVGGLDDPYLYLFDPDLDLAAEDDDSAGSSNSSITFTATTTGAYYLGAMDFDEGTGGYTLSATANADDYPANTGTTGVVLVNGSAAAGVIEVAGDADYFKVLLSAGFTYSFSLVRTAGGLVDPFLFLINGSLATVASDDDSAGSLNSRITYTATTSGLHYLAASDLANGTGGYTLSAVLVDAVAPTLLSSIPSDNAASVGVATNLVFTFSEAVRAGTGNITIFNGNGTIARTIAITDATQVTIAGDTLTVNPGTDLAASSNYYVNIAAGAIEDLSGNDFAGIAGTTALNFTTLATDDYPWSTATTGVVAVDGSASTGLIGTAGDQDLFKVTLVADTTYIFDLARTAGGLSDPMLYLYTPTVVLAASDDESGGSGNARITYTAPASGVYYLGATDFGSGTGSYTLGAARTGTGQAVNGTSGNNSLLGTSGSDAISGFDGNDTMTGGLGNDAIDGGTGLDFAVFTGSRSNYAINRNSDTTAIVSGPDGIDSLTNVERLKFSDSYIAIDLQGNGGAAYRLYQAAFDRAPDLGGLGYQMNELDHGAALTWVAGNFIASPEFQNTYGALNNEQFVTRLYLNVLDRLPDAGGLAYHLDRMAHGVGREVILVGFSESPENYGNVLPAIQNGMVYLL